MAETGLGDVAKIAREGVEYEPGVKYDLIDTFTYAKAIAGGSIGALFEAGANTQEAYNAVCSHGKDSGEALSDAVATRNLVLEFDVATSGATYRHPKEVVQTLTEMAVLERQFGRDGLGIGAAADSYLSQTTAREITSGEVSPATLKARLSDAVGTSPYPDIARDVVDIFVERYEQRL